MKRKEVREMAKYYGGEPVAEGFYLNRNTLWLEAIGRGGGVLPGSRFTRYRRMHLLEVMAVGPLMGLAYVTFLPVAAWCAFACFAARRLARRVKLARQQQENLRQPWY
jgi:hypothetical protein